MQTFPKLIGLLKLQGKVTDGKKGVHKNACIIVIGLLSDSQNLAFLTKGKKKTQKTPTSFMKPQVVLKSKSLLLIILKS